jgi:hypothetical protein
VHTYIFSLQLLTHFEQLFKILINGIINVHHRITNSTQFLTRLRNFSAEKKTAERVFGQGERLRSRSRSQTSRRSRLLSPTSTRFQPKRINLTMFASFCTLLAEDVFDLSQTFKHKCFCNEGNADYEVILHITRFGRYEDTECMSL